MPLFRLVFWLVAIMTVLFGGQAAACTMSPNLSVISTTGSITDANCHVWTLSGQQVVVDGKTDTTTGAVVNLAFVNGAMWQENSGCNWWSEVLPTASWAPTGGTTTGPNVSTLVPSASGSTVTTPGSSLVDASGNVWTLTVTGGEVAANGVTNTTQAGVNQILYYNKLIYITNTSGKWFSIATPTSPYVAFSGDPRLIEILTVTNIPVAVTNQSFLVSGTIAGDTTAPTLQFQDGAGAWAALPSGAVVTSTTFSFTNTGIVAAASMTVSVRDANNNAVTASSNAFTVATPSPSGTVVTTVGPTVIDSIGEIFSLTANPGQIAVGNPPVADNTTSGVVALAYVTGNVWQENSANLWWYKAQASGTWAPTGGTSVSPLTTETLALAAISQQTANVAFGVSGAVTNDTVAPALQYQVDGGAWAALPGGATVTSSTFAFTVPGIAAGSSHTISVRDSVTTTISTTSNIFSVIAAPVETFAINAIPSQAAGVLFTVSGIIAGDSVAPSLQYEDSGGAWSALPGTPTVTSTSFSFVNPGLSATASATVGIRDAAATATTALSNSFSVAAAPVESISISPISPALQGTPFAVGGTVLNARSALVLQYEDNTGGWQPLPSGFSLSGAPGTATFSFINPSLSAGASNTVSVRDASNNAISATSGGFAVTFPPSPNDTVVTTVGPTIVDASGESFSLTAAGQVAVNGVPDSSSANAKALAYVSSTVWYESVSNLWFSKTISTFAWSPPGGTGTSPLPAEGLAVGTIGPQTTANAFTVSGSIGNALLIPSLQYQVSGGGAWTALSAGSPISLTAFSFTVPAISAAGSYTVSVRDANAPTIVAASNAFTNTQAVSAPETVLIAPIATQQAGYQFAVSGSIGNVTSIRAFDYQDNGGIWQPLPQGASVSTIGFAFVHPGMAANPAVTVAVRDHLTQTVVSTSGPFLVAGQQSQNLATVVTVGPQIIDAPGNAYTLTPSGQVAINGIADGTTSGAIEIAYVSGSVWYENGSKLWSERSVSSWLTGTLLGPLPSSQPQVYMTWVMPLAVVPGFTVGVPGIVITDTVPAGTFSLSLTSTDGTLTLPGGTGTGSAAVSMVGSLGTLNAALTALMFTGTQVGPGAVNILVTDPAGITTTAEIPVTVPRGAPVTTYGRFQ